MAHIVFFNAPIFDRRVRAEMPFWQGGHGYNPLTFCRTRLSGAVVTPNPVGLAALRFLAGEAFGGGSPRSPPTSRTAISALGPSVDDRPRAVVAGEEQRVDEAVVAFT